MARLKQNIFNIIEKMPEENQFCKQCNGERKLLCYGGYHPKLYPNYEEFAKNLYWIDPYKDEKTFQYLVKRKERLGDEKLTQNEIEKFIKFAKKAKGYDVRFGKQKRED